MKIPRAPAGLVCVHYAALAYCTALHRPEMKKRCQAQKPEVACHKSGEIGERRFWALTKSAGGEYPACSNIFIEISNIRNFSARMR